MPQNTVIENYLKEKGLWEEYFQIRKKMCTYLDNIEDIKYLYIIVLGDSNALYDMYLLDDYDTPLYQTGSYEDREPELMGMDTSAGIAPMMTHDKWGSLCCSYAPIYTKDGTLVCHVGCDMDMENMLLERRQYILYMFIGAVGITFLALLIAVFFTNKFFTHPIRQLTEEAKKFSPVKNANYKEACVLELPRTSLNEVSDIYEVIRTTQMNIIDYLNDMSKHTATEAQRIHAVWRSVPSQLAKENKKFVYKNIAPGARAREYEMAIQWLVDAGLVLKLRRCLNPTMPLSFYEDTEAFKLYLLDVGLLGAMSNAPARLMVIANKVFVEFKGAFSENYVFQQLKTLGDLPLYYFSKDNSTQEVDFLMQTDERIIPIEVKAEENTKSKSLNGFVNVDHADKHLKALRCSMLPYADQGWMENIPLYSVLAYFSDLAE